MKGLLLYVCCLLAAAVAAGEEIDSLETPGKPSFFRVDDSVSELPFPVSSTNTIGSPRWYHKLEGIVTPYAWIARLADGSVVSNRYGNGPGGDPYHSFALHPTFTWPETYQSKWGVVYKVLDEFDASGMWFPNLSAWPHEPFVVSSGSDPDGNGMPLVNRTGPGTVELVIEYYESTPEAVEQRRKSVTLFPIMTNDCVTSVETAYPTPDPGTGEDVKIWLPSSTRLSMSSRSSLVAAYEAWCERMYWASRGEGYGGEDVGEWESLGLGSPDPGPDFAFQCMDKASPWMDGVPDDLGILDETLYPTSSYSGLRPSCRRHYPANCFRLDERRMIRRFCNSVRKMSPMYAHADPIHDGTLIPAELRKGTSFLARPQWLLDGREADRLSYIYRGFGSDLWWSTSVEPALVPQLEYWYDERDDLRHPPDYVPAEGDFEEYHMAEIEDMYLFHADPDYSGGFPSARGFMTEIKPEMRTFTLNLLTTLPDDSSGCDVHNYPFAAALRYALEGIYFYVPFQDLASDDIRGYDLESFGQESMIALVSSNYVKSSAYKVTNRHFPSTRDSGDDVLYAFSYAADDDGWQVSPDTRAISLGSQYLGLMDRTYHIPFHLPIFTNTYWTAYSFAKVSMPPPVEEQVRIRLVERLDGETGYYGLSADEDIEVTGFFNVSKVSVGSDFEYQYERHDNVVELWSSRPDDIPTPPFPKSLFSGERLENEPEKAIYKGMEIDGLADGKHKITGVTYGDPLEFRLSAGLFVRIEGLLDWQYVPTVGSESPDGAIFLLLEPRQTETQTVWRTYGCCIPSMSPGGSISVGPTCRTGENAKGIVAQVLAAGSMYAEDMDRGIYEPYWDLSFITARNKSDAGSRSELVRGINESKDDIIEDFEEIWEEVISYDPRDPEEYAPIPDSYRASAKFSTDSDAILPFFIRPDASAHVTRSFPDGGTIDEYKFDVVDDLTVEAVEDEFRIVEEEWFYMLDEGFHFYQQEDGTYVLLGPVVTNVVFSTRESRTDRAYKTTVHDVAVISAHTNEVTRRTFNGGTKLKPYQQYVASNVWHRTLYNGEEDMKSVERRRNNVSETLYYHETNGTVRTVAGREYTFRSEYPLYPPGDSEWIAYKYAHMVDLSPSDAKSHTSYPSTKIYSYDVYVDIEEGTVKGISYYSPEGGPDIDDTDKFVLAGVYVDGSFFDGGEFSPWTYDTSSPGEQGEMDAYMGMSVIIKTDWTWNALNNNK